VDKKIEEKNTSILDQGNKEWKEVMSIDIGVAVAGVFKEDDSGKICIEGELNIPKWKQPNQLAVEIGGLTEKVNNLPVGSVKYMPRMTPIGEGLILAKVIILVKESVAIAFNEAKNVARKFIEKTTVQATLPWHSNEEMEKISPEIIEIIENSAKEFLKAHGGKSLRAGMSINMGGDSIAEFGGSWKNCPAGDNSNDEEKVIEGHYNGRNLRQRYINFVEASKKAKNFEIYYDDNDFDEPLRELKDNKNASLKLTCKVVPKGKNTRLVLDKMEVLKITEEL
jgi:hypothetical protein